MTSSPREPFPAETHSISPTEAAASSAPARFPWNLIKPWCGLLQREQSRIRAEILSFQGLMPLLMQQRNGRLWTAAERAQLSQHLRRLTSLSPYLLTLLAPGSFVLLPLLAWWLDRRRTQRNEGGSKKASSFPRT